MTDTHWNDDRKMIVKNRVVSYQTEREGGFKRYLKNFDSVGYDITRWIFSSSGTHRGLSQPGTDVVTGSAETFHFFTVIVCVVWLMVAP